MTRSSFDPVRLIVQASDPGTEIFVVDGRLQRIASGAGRIVVEVEPGLYKVRLRSGATQRDELLSVEPGAGEVTFQAEPVEFRSAAPLEGTRTTHEYHRAPASHISRSATRAAGSGSELFLFLREEERGGPTLQVDSVTLRNLAGEEIADLAEGEADERAGFAGLNLEVDPGTYRVRVETGPLGSYDLFATATLGWQTQVFLVTEDFWSGEAKVRRPSLRLASLLMAPRGAGFDPHSPDARLSELARQALAQGRQVLDRETMGHLLHEKFHDPLLGIYAAHLLLMERPIQWTLLEEVCGNLHGLLGPHPDVQALLLRLGEESGRPSWTGTLEGVPTLRRSWELIVSAARRRPSLVPGESVLARVAQNVASAQPYLLHRVGRESAPAATAEEGALTMEEMMQQAAGLLEGEPGGMSEILARVRSRQVALSGLEQTLLGRMIASVKEKETLLVPVGEGALGFGLLDAEEASADEEAGSAPSKERSAGLRLLRAMHGVKAPPSAVSASLASLMQKLEG